MSKGRKNGCPTNIRDWSILIQDKSQVSETFIRIKGLEEMKHSTDATTEDGSATADLWEEPYVTKRSGKLTLSGKPLVNASTGMADAGQAMLDEYLESGKCEDDATIKIVDPYGTGVVGDFIVTGKEGSSGDDEDTCSWDLEQVGPVEKLPYVQLASLSFKDGNNAVSLLSFEPGDAAKVITIVFNPADASNQRFRVKTGNNQIVSISNITENAFTVTPVGGLGTTTITVTAVNGGITATLTAKVAIPGS